MSERGERVARWGQTTGWFGAQLRRHGGIAILALLFVAVGVRYGDTTPIFEGPGEPWHYVRVERYAGERFSPALVELRAAKRRGPEDAEPPLYYWLAAALVRDVPISQDETNYTLNPWVVMGDPASTGNRNAVVRLAPDDPPYQGVSAAVHRLRTVGVLLSAITVCLVYTMGRMLAPTRRDLALGAAAMTAFTPGFLFRSALVHNGALAVLTCTGALLLAMCVRRWPGKAAISIGLGATVGLAVLSSRAAAITLALIPLAYISRRERRLGISWRPMGIALLAALVVCGWWLLPRSAELLRPRPATYETALPTASTVGATLGQLLGSYWATFGWLNVPAEPWLYSLIAVLSLVSLGGGLLLALRLRWLGRRTQRCVQRWGYLPLAWIALVAAGLLWEGRLQHWPQGPQLYLAIGPLSFLLYSGLVGWAAHRRYLLVTALTLGLGSVAFLVPRLFIAPAYAQPQRLALQDVPRDMRPLDLAFGEDLFLLGYTMEQESVTIGKPVRVRLYWVGRRRMFDDYTFSVFLLGREGALLGTVNAYPGRGNYPTRLWLPGEVVIDDYWVPVSSAARAPAGGSLRISVYERSGGTPIEATDWLGRNVGGAPQIATVRLSAPYRLVYEPERVVHHTFGERVALTGYSISPQNPAAEDEWEIHLLWQPLRRMSYDYTVFVHLVDEQGTVVAQADGSPVDGDYPTTLWRMGDQVADVHVMRLPEAVASGRYSLHVGWYLLETGERLMLDGADPLTDYAVLGPFYFDARIRPEAEDPIRGSRN